MTWRKVFACELAIYHDVEVPLLAFVVHLRQPIHIPQIPAAKTWHDNCTWYTSVLAVLEHHVACLYQAQLHANVAKKGALLVYTPLIWIA